MKTSFLSLLLHPAFYSFGPSQTARKQLNSLARVYPLSKHLKGEDMDCNTVTPVVSSNMWPLFIVMASVIVFFAAVSLLIKAWINCMIFHKAGYSWAWGLFTLVPVANIIIAFVLALGNWPVRRELYRLKEAAKTQTT
jgi:hypothetical protein